MALKKSVNLQKDQKALSKRLQQKVTKIKVAARRKANSKVANNKSKIAPYKPKKNEKYMSAAMKKHFIAVLLQWREHLREEMQKTLII